MRKLTKNTVIESVEIEDIAAEGKCIARVDDKVVFVRNVAPRDIIDLRITRNKKNFAEGIAERIVEPSPNRAEPFCSHFGICGGCKWQHVDYETQLFYKQKQVSDNLERIGKVSLPDINPIMGSENTKYYRNKLEFTFSSKRWLTKEEISTGEKIEKNGLGFHIPRRFDKVIDVEHCYLQPDPSNAIRLAVKKYAKENNLPFFDLVDQKGLLRTMVIRTANSGDVMVIIQFANDDNEAIEGLMSHLKVSFSEITSLLYVINGKKNDTFQDLEVKTFSGLPYIEENMPAFENESKILKFRVGPKSFYQTNSAQAHELYKAAALLANISDQDVIYDLYTGTGTIANFIAGKAKKVVGIEYVPEAIEDAKVNSQINDIANASFFAGDMKDLLNDEFLAENGLPDVVITDPPRAGMHESVLRKLLDIAAKKIVYVSCNPATQARDVAILSEKYEIASVQPVDMFPHTHHVENIVLLTLK